MSATTEELLEFIKDVLYREDRTLGDGGVLLNDEVREEGLRLLHKSGWKTQQEDDEEAREEDDYEESEEP